MSDAPTPWRFIAARDVPECGILRGDLITAYPGRPTRLVRQLPINPGLLLNLAMQDFIVEVEGIIGSEAPIVAALDAVDQPATSPAASLRVVR